MLRHRANLKYCNKRLKNKLETSNSKKTKADKQELCKNTTLENFDEQQNNVYKIGGRYKTRTKLAGVHLNISQSLACMLCFDSFIIQVFIGIKLFRYLSSWLYWIIITHTTREIRLKIKQICYTCCKQQKWNATTVKRHFKYYNRIIWARMATLGGVT